MQNQGRYSPYIWATAHFLIKERGYKLIQIQSQDGTTDPPSQITAVHLLKKIGSDLRYIRLSLADFVWSSVVERNVKESAATAELFRKKFKAKKIDGLNLYFFPSTPMTDILNRVTDFGKVRIGSTTFLQTVCVDLEHKTLLNPIIDAPSYQFHNEELMQILSRDPYSTASYIQDLMKEEAKKRQEIRQFFQNSKPLLTYIILGLIAIFWVLLELSGGSTNKETLIEYGAKHSLYIAINGEWWRLFTSMFLHIGFMHLAFNGLALYYLGTSVEQMFGQVRFLAIYLIAGLVGSLASFAVGPVNAVSAGASGAIYGLFGALLYFGLRRRDLFFQTMGKDILVVLGINLVLSILVASIDLFAHVGGLVGGFFAAMFVGLPQLQQRKDFRLNFVGIVAIVAISWICVKIGYDRAHEFWDAFLRSLQ